MFRVGDDESGRIGRAEQQVAKAGGHRNASFVIDVVFESTSEHGLVS